MTWIFFILMCILVSFLVVKYTKVFIAILGILASIFVLGFVVMPINLDLGVKMSTYAFVYLIVGGIVFAVSGIVSAFVVAPLVIIWESLKSLFNK